MLIALLLAAWMPFCCCNFHALASACSACEPSPQCDIGAAAAERGAACGYACPDHDDDEPESSRPGDPDDPPDRDDGPCACGKDKLATIGLDKATIEFPAPAPILAPPTRVFVWVARGRNRALDRADFAPHRPATSLLRLHCALIV